MSITITINQADMDKVKKMLAGVKDGAPKVLARSINKTLTGVVTDASTEIRTVITAKKSAVDNTLRKERATPTHLSGLVASTGKPLPLSAFSVNQTLKGVSVRVRKDRPRSVVKGAFLATVRTQAQAEGGSAGHKGVFWRVWHAKKGPKRKIPYGKLPRKYRLPIKQLFGPRIPDILSNDPVMTVVLKKAGERLHKNIEHELSYELSKL